MLTAVARDQRVSSKFAFVLFCYLTNHLMTGPLRDSEFLLSALDQKTFQERVFKTVKNRKRSG